VIGLLRIVLGRARGLLPEVWILICAALVLFGFLVWNHFDNAAAIEQHDQAREAAGAAGRERSAEEAVSDAFENQRLRDRRDAEIAQAAATEAAKPPAARATTTPQGLALNCAIAREDYTPTELANMPEYQEHCR
jgi:cytoskeletal protein RodZ